MRAIGRCAAVSLCFLALALPAGASVVYEFSGVSEGIFGPGIFVAQSFTYTSPSFITSDLTVPAASLDACATALETCVSVKFYPVSPFLAGQAMIDFATDTTGTFYYLPLGALSIPGVHPVEVAHSGTLTVSVTGVVPEPDSFGLLAVPAAAVLLWRRWRRGRPRDASS